MAEEKKPPQITKRGKIEQHFLANGSLSSKEAVDLYVAMRIASVVHRMKGVGWKFRHEEETGKDRYGNESTWMRYHLISSPSSEEKKAISEKKKRKIITSSIMPAEVPPDKSVVLRPRQYKKHEGNTKEFAGKSIIQINLFENGNEEI
jgi:hypothetical protein